MEAGIRRYRSMSGDRAVASRRAWPGSGNTSPVSARPCPLSRSAGYEPLRPLRRSPTLLYVPDGRPLAIWNPASVDRVTRSTAPEFAIIATRENTPSTRRSASGAGGARTHDRRIMRSTASCTERASCTDGTGHRTDDSHCAGIIRRVVPRTVPRGRRLTPDGRDQE